jgi:hypothetical protein
MNEFDALRGITRRAIPINYVSPLICHNDVPFSASGTGDLSLLDILPTLQEVGPVLALTQPNAGENRLEWMLVANAFSYVIYRATVEGGPYLLLTSGVVENFYVDTPDVPGTYYYKATGIEPNYGETLASNIVSGTV